MSSEDAAPPFWPPNNAIGGGPYRPPMDKRYALSGKIMLIAIFVLLAVVVFMIFLHIYARCYLFPRRRRTHLRHRRGHLVFYIEPTGSFPSSSTVSLGLDPAILKSLPTFTYSSHPAGASADENAPECAVCLSEFEDGETGRRLPKCNHSFHVDCIDMWFHSHSTCPLCRTPVDGDFTARMEDIAVELSESTRSESTHPETPELDTDSLSASSSFGRRRKEMGMVGVSVNVPARSASFSFSNSDDLLPSSPAGQGLKSPTSRLLSLKRILSREKRPSSSCSALETSGSELAQMEEGRVETRTSESRTQTPR